MNPQSLACLKLGTFENQSLGDYIQVSHVKSHFLCHEGILEISFLFSSEGFLNRDTAFSQGWEAHNLTFITIRLFILKQELLLVKVASFLRFL